MTVVVRTPGVKVAALCLVVAVLAAPAALAKGRITVALGDSTPRVGQPFTVYVSTGFVVPANDWLRLIAVAPDGRVLVDRYLDTDTLVGSRGDRHDALVRFVLRQAMDMARPDLKRALNP